MSRDFWSRRREGVAREAQKEAALVEEQAAAETEAKLAERSDDEILQDLELPQPEDLDSPEAVRGFLNAQVPQRLKTRALRQLWKLNPVLANLDGLVDYGEDFTDAAMVVENLQTAYQVGKGMLSHIEALAAKEAEKAAAAEDEAEDAGVEASEAGLALAEAQGAATLPEDPVDAQGAVPAPEADTHVMAQTMAPPQTDDAEPFQAGPSRRRMRFSFEEQV